MHLAHLSLSNVRTFRKLEVELSPATYVIDSPNAGGKTNLLEAIALLATARTSRSGGDAALIAWQALAEDPLPAARIAARVESKADQVTLEITVISRPAGDPAHASEAARSPVASRRFRVNGVARRASDLIGRFRVVMFSADDLTIIDGPPAARRRYLDITISQVDAGYVRALQRYGRVVSQRNSLLRRFHEGRRDPAELDFWDDELASTGAQILAARSRAIAELAAGAAERHEELTGGGHALDIEYRPAIPGDFSASLSATGLAAPLRDAIVAQRRDDIRRGVTQIGPHRDNISFLLDGHEAAHSASRGEHRSVALSLRLAEVAFSTARTGDPPVLLLDDILSELDPERRERVLAVAYGVDQVLITTPDPDRPPPQALPDARRFRIEGGALIEAS